VELSSKILRAIGGEPPEGFNYELFLDENGERISKSRGNGLSIEEWLAYGPRRASRCSCTKSRALAKRLYFDVIPKAVDEYIELLRQYWSLSEDSQRIESAVWHIHVGDPPPDSYPVSFALLLNLVSASNAQTAMCCGVSSVLTRLPLIPIPIRRSIAWSDMRFATTRIG